jgi:hypothetical protein
MAKYSVLKSFYASEKWQNFRLNLIVERKPICERCKEVVLDTKKLIGHHKEELTPENVNDYSVSLNPNLVELICHNCHNKEHGRFGYKKTKEVFIVYGSPLAGKKTYVSQNMSRGDLVIDMDIIYSALSMLPYYDKPDNLFNNVIGIHNMLIDNVKTRYGKWNNAWIIGGYADKFKRERLGNELGAELIYCDVGKEECLRRLEVDIDRQWRKDEWIGYIEKWYQQYTP